MLNMLIVRRIMVPFSKLIPHRNCMAKYYLFIAEFVFTYFWGTPAVENMPKMPHFWLKSLFKCQIYR